MKIALDWLGQYLSPAPSAQGAAEALMNAGLPVESVAEGVGAAGPTKVLDVEVTSNRSDCLSYVGVARELSALVGGTFMMPGVKLNEGPLEARQLTSVENKDLAGCSYYSARIVRNVRVGPSPSWLQRRLESIGLRPVNNVVDVTNFVLMELGQPLHAFDYDKLEGRRIVVRRAAGWEKMMAIDGREYALDASMLVIADGKSPAAIAGVMGGKASEVTEKTTTVLLESARFDPLTIRTTSRALGLKSDSSYRFERGIDPAMAEFASRRAAELLVEAAGGEVAQGVVIAGVLPGKLGAVTMRLGRFEKIVGIRVAADRAISILGALGFSPALNENSAGDDDDVIVARVPTHRLDVSREIDLIEEVARVHGYGHVPTLERVTHGVKGETVREKGMRAVRDVMIEAGFSEAVTLAFLPEREARGFLMAGSDLIRPEHAGWKADALRPSLLPSLLAVRRTNQYAGIADARVFETAETFWQAAEEKAGRAPAQRRILGAVAGEVSALTGVLELLARKLNPGVRLFVEPAEGASYFQAGASGMVRMEIRNLKSEIRDVGRVGVFTLELQKRYDLRGAVAGMELELEALLAVYEAVRRAAALPRFPGVNRDLSIVVEEGVRWAEVEKAVKGAGLAALSGVDFVTTFRNKQVGEGKKSLTLTLEFRDANKTLVSEEVDGEVAKAVKLLGEKFGAVLRA